jgi:hypothetical protein
MRYGFVVSDGSPAEQIELAVEAEAAGWDAVFSYEAAYGIDPWCLLTAMAMRTERVQLGTMLTPLPWRRPWKVASQASTLHALSGGRAILAVGTGAVDAALGRTGEPTDLKSRAGLLDEGIDVMRALWSGDMTFTGERYEIDLSPRKDAAAELLPVPLWCVGVWPAEKSMDRILRCDGLLPAALALDGDEPLWPGARFKRMTPDEIALCRAWLDERGATSTDIIWEGATPGDDSAAARAVVQPWADAGATWWLESRWADGAEMRTRLRAGPPR